METFAETESRKRERSQFEEEEETETAQKKPDLRNEISESKPESDKDSNIEKPLDEWTADEVQQWFQKNDFSKYYPKFEGLSGKLLSKLSENNFISLLKDNDAIAMALYNTIQELKAQTTSIDDPFIILKSIVQKLQISEGPPKPPTSCYFPYQKEDRIEDLEKLWKEGISINWKSFLEKRFSDKKAWISMFIHGISGVGKTRFSLMLLELLKEYISRQRFNNDADVVALRNALSKSRTVLLDIQHNGNSISVLERGWQADIILGLRLASNYWFPNIPYSDIRDEIRILLRNNKIDLEVFSIRSVLRYISQHPPPSMSSSNTNPEIPQVLHIAIDEIQVAFEMGTSYQGSRELEASKTEPLSKALNRALINAIGTSSQLFVIGTMAGTAVEHPKEVLDATDHPSFNILLKNLSLNSILNIALSFQFTKDGCIVATGKDWISKGEIFNRILLASGGNARSLECLQEVLNKRYTPPPEDVNLREIIEPWVESVAQKFNVESWGKGDGNYLFGLYLGLAGIPVTRNLNISPPKAPKVTIEELERAGLIQLRPPPNVINSVWRNTWGVGPNNFIIDIPLILVLATLRNVSSSDYQDLFPEAKTILNKFYYNPSSFEEFAIRHRYFRYRVASQLAILKKRKYVPAFDLFCGSICSPEFTSLQFVPNIQYTDLKSAKGIWCSNLENTSNLSTKITSQLYNVESTIDLKQEKPFVLWLSGRNVLDGVQNVKLLEASSKKALIWIDTKHGEFNNDDTIDPGEISKLIKKRMLLEQKLPTLQHILVIVTSKPARQRGGLPHTANTILLQPEINSNIVDPFSCLISDTEEGLAWAFSPIMASFLVPDRNQASVITNQ